MMKDLLKKEGLFLHYLISLPDHDKKSVIKHLTSSQINTICGIVLNAINKVFDIKQSDIILLKKYNTSWSLLVDKKIKLGRKKVLISRRFKEICIILRAALKWIPIKK